MKFPNIGSDKSKKLAIGAATAALAAGAILAPDIALAQQSNADDQFLREGTSRIREVWESAKEIILVVGALGLVVMAIFAFFGRFQWKYFFSLAGGLFLILFAEQLINFLGGSQSDLQGL